MSLETMYDIDFSSPQSISRELYTNVGSSAFQIGATAAVSFLGGTDFEIWDSSSGGTQLTENTDYTLSVLDEELMSYDTVGSRNIYLRCTVTNATYQTGNIYISYKIVSQQPSAAVFNELQSQVTTNTNNISALSASTVFEIYNLELSNGTDTDHDIDIETGQCLDSTLTDSMVLSSGLTKQIDATWAAGTNAGGLFSGTVANGTTYHVFLIKKDSDGSIDAGFDTSVIAANIPSGYTSYRRLGSIVTNGSANIRQFIHTWQDKMFKWKTKKITQSSWQVPTSATLTALDVPTGINVKPLGLFSGGLSTGTNRMAFNIYSYDETPPALAQFGSSETGFNGVTGNEHRSSGVYRGDSLFENLQQFRTNTSGQLYFLRIGTYVSSSYYSTLITHGWIDYTL